MKDTFSVKIITPEGITFKDSVKSLSAPGHEGYFGVWNKHTPIITQLKKGVITCINTEKKIYFAINSGVLEVKEDHNVLILSDGTQEASDYEEAKKLTKKTT